jgi:MraZ protein
VLISPGPDKCLWLTNQPHLDRLTTRLENSPAREADLRVFRRLYYAQTVKVPMKEGRVAIADRLAQFAGLDQELVLVGIDDHFEIWDAARWRRYTQAKKAAPLDAE